MHLRIIEISTGKTVGQYEADSESDAVKQHHKKHKAFDRPSHHVVDVTEEIEQAARAAFEASLPPDYEPPVIEELGSLRDSDEK